MQFELSITGNELLDAEHHSELWVMNCCKDESILQKNIVKINRVFIPHNKGTSVLRK